MKLFEATPPPFDIATWAKAPFAERARLSVQAFGRDGNGSPGFVYIFYGVKQAAYVAGWLAILALANDTRDFTRADFWLAPVAYQKAVAWTMLYEVLGFGCGSGPLTGRIKPMVGAFRHWLRVGTTKLPLFEGAPLIGGYRRGLFEVALYGGLLGLLMRALAVPAPGPSEWLPIIALLPLLGVLDRPIFLAARAEHYWVMMVTFALLDDWVAGAMVVQLAMWFFAGVSKLNAHFPSVVAVMTSNSPTAPGHLKRAMYRAYPGDMRPSATARFHAIAGTCLELSLPCVALSAVAMPSPTLLALAMVMCLMLHGFILSNVPIGVPLEWNFMMIYGGFFLFLGHPNTTPADIDSAVVAAFLGLMCVVVPIVGNFLPERISFLLAMRYYAGNWPVSVFFFRADSYRRLERLTKAAPWLADQIRARQPGLSEDSVRFAMASSQAFRLLHLHGRAIHSLLPRLVDDIEQYTWVDGEVIAGISLGWNFGEGHLHNERLLRALQSQCAFEPGELRCLFLEAQPLLGKEQAYRLYDANTGQLARGTFPVARMRELPPWPEDTPNVSAQPG